MRRAIWVLGVVLLAAAGCGGDDGTTASATTAEASISTAGGGDGSTATTAPTATTAGDEEATTVPFDEGGTIPAADLVDASVDDLVGTWQSSYGILVVRQVGARILATYDTDEGTITLVDAGHGEFDGWWTEVPSRDPANDDAGVVNFQAEQGADGNLFFNGVWDYGDVADPQNIWTLTATEDPAPQALLDRFDDPAAFVDHP
jgi:hypothetical protein